MTCEICKKGIAKTNAHTWNPLRKRICATCEDLVITYHILNYHLYKVIDLKSDIFRKYKDIESSKLVKRVKDFKTTTDKEGQEILNHVENHYTKIFKI